MKNQLEQIRAAALAAIAEAADGKAVEELRVKYLGKKGEITAILKQMGSLSAEERPVMGQLANEVRAAIEAAIAESAEKMKAAALEAQLKAETVDITMPAKKRSVGSIHPINKVANDLIDIFHAEVYTSRAYGL